METAGSKRLKRFGALIDKKIDELDVKSVAARDLSNMISTYEKLQKQEGESLFEQWLRKLQDVIKASDAIERLAFDGEESDFEDTFKLIFDKGKKKRIVLG